MSTQRQHARYADAFVAAVNLFMATERPQYIVRVTYVDDDRCRCGYDVQETPVAQTVAVIGIPDRKAAA